MKHRREESPSGGYLLLRYAIVYERFQPEQPEGDHQIDHQCRRAVDCVQNRKSQQMGNAENDHNIGKEDQRPDDRGRNGPELFGKQHRQKTMWVFFIVHGHSSFRKSRSKGLSSSVET